MTTRFDNLFGNLAVQLIDRTFGADATLRKISRTYNVATGTSSETVTDYPVKVSPPTRDGTGTRAGFREERIDGLAEGTISFAWIATRSLPAAAVPAIDDVLIYRGIEYQIVATNDQNSGDETAAIQMELRS